MNKLTKTASTLRNIFNIAEKVLMAGTIAALVCVILAVGCLLLGVDPDLIGTGYENLNIGVLKLQIADGFAPDKNIVLIKVAIFIGLIGGCCLIGWKMVRSINAILDPISQGRPFHSAISAELKKLAIYSIGLGVVFNLFGLTDLIFNAFIYDLPDLLISEKITHVGLDYTMDISFLICSGILLLLSYIFRYGSELQQLSDETL